MTSEHNEDDDYNSSSDEDYDPTKDNCDGQDEVDDNSGDEEEIDEDEVVKAEEGITKTSSDTKTSSEEVDVDAFFAELKGIKPSSSSTKNPDASSVVDTPKVEEKCYPRPVRNESSEATELPKVYPRKLQSTTTESVKPTGTKRVGLLDAAKALSKRSKMSVLDRSDQDWKDFTAQNNLKEDLESHNRGKGGYLNKMEFLTRADNRQFEKEKAFRASARKDN